jgi:hypothetical protein
MSSSIPGPSSSSQLPPANFYPPSTVKVPKYHAEHKRDEVEHFEKMRVCESTDHTTFLSFLGVPDGNLPAKNSKAPEKFKLKTFIDAANVLAKSMRNARESILPLDIMMWLFSPTFNFKCRVCQQRHPPVQVHRREVSHWPCYRR